jgi:hypothetical protein
VTATPQPLYPRERNPVHIARKAFLPPGFDPWTVRPVASRCTALATSAHPRTFLAPLITYRKTRHLNQAQNKTACQNYSNSSLSALPFKGLSVVVVALKSVS